MGIESLLPLPTPVTDWYALFPQVERGLSPGSPIGLESLWTLPPNLRPSQGSTSRPQYGMGSTLSTGNRFNYAVQDGVPCYELWTDNATVEAVTTWNMPYMYGPPVGTAGRNPGYSNPEAVRVLRVRFGLRHGAGTIRTSTDTGVGLMASDGATVTAFEALPSGADPRVICALNPVNAGGTARWEYNAFDAAGAVIHTVALTSEVPDARDWSTVDFQVVASDAAREAALTVAVNGVLVVEDTLGSATLTAPSAFIADYTNLCWASYCAATGLSTPMYYWWEARGTRFTRSGQPVTS